MAKSNMAKSKRNRMNESDTVARVLTEILKANPAVPGVPPSSLKNALEIAISLFKARALDAETEGN